MSLRENAIIPRMFLRSMGLLLICATAFAAPAHPAQSLIAIEEDLRFFAVVAALNVAGFDVELSSEYHGVRAEIRKVADSLDPDLLRRLREFYSTHKAGAPEETQLAKYISLAVVLGDPPLFKPVAREESLPNDARSVLDFVPLLQEFYQKAPVPRLWASVSEAYAEEMDRIGPPIRDVIARTDAYLRVASGAGASSQAMKISVELGAPQNSVNVRSHQENYYVILGYTSTPKTEEIRHAYLHLRLNDYAAAAAQKVQKSDGIMALLSGQEGVQPEYSSNFENMMSESLVRAAELRIDREAASAAQEKVRNYYRTGLLLTPYFYEALVAYEAGETPLRAELGTIAAAIDAGKELDRFEEIFHTIPLPERQPLRAEVPEPRTDPVLELLRTAEAVFDKDKARAREAFEKVLRDYDPENGAALYGLALIEMDRANLDEALKYFERTIKSESAATSRKTWSYIYSGHILDFKCNRAAAIENYQKAIETGDDTRDAQNTARRDLAQPFGGGCRQ